MAGERVKVDTPLDVFKQIIDLAFFYKEDKKQTEISWTMESGEAFSIYVEANSSPLEIVQAINKRMEQDGCSAEGQESRCP